MFVRSLRLRVLLRLSERGLASKSRPPQPGNVKPPSSATAEGGSGGKLLLAGAALAATGGAVYYYRDLWHEYPLHPFIKKPTPQPLKSVQTLNGHPQSISQEMQTSRESMGQPIAFNKAETVDGISVNKQSKANAAMTRQSETNGRSLSGSGADSTAATKNGATEENGVMELTKEASEKKDRAVQVDNGSEETVPLQIADDTALVELFSQALGQQAHTSELSQSGLDADRVVDDDDVTVDVDVLLKGEMDVSVISGKLLASALKEAIQTQPSPNWEAFKTRHRQALNDASVLKQLVEKERAASKVTTNDTVGQLPTNVKAVEDDLRIAIHKHQETIQKLEQSLQETKGGVDLKIKEALDRAEKKHARHLEKATEAVKVKAAEKLTTERTQRMERIDELRQNVNVLTMALKEWMGHVRTLERAQRNATEASSMERLMEDAHLDWLRTLKDHQPTDPLLKAAFACFPKEAIPSRRELIRRLDALRSNLECYALMPASGGGLLSQMVANLGARLKIKVPEMYGDGDDIGSKLDRVERALVDGSVTSAIALMDDITIATGAEHLSREWTNDARRYASLQEIRKIYLARAQELSISVSPTRV